MVHGKKYMCWMMEIFLSPTRHGDRCCAMERTQDLFRSRFLCLCTFKTKVFVVIDPKPKELGLPTEAYYSVEEPKEATVQRTFQHIPAVIDASEAEEVGVGHLLRDVKDSSVSTLTGEVSRNYRLKVYVLKMIVEENTLLTEMVFVSPFFRGCCRSNVSLRCSFALVGHVKACCVEEFDASTSGAPSVSVERRRRKNPSEQRDYVQHAGHIQPTSGLQRHPNRPILRLEDQ